jgi:hypothetical protein
MIAECLDLEECDHLIVAGYRLARTFDDTASLYDHPYHNSQHTCEVMLSSYFLSLLRGLNKHETAEIILAALIHDFQHDGRINGDVSFRLERHAINEATPYLLATEITEVQQRNIAALILSTDITIGLNIARASYAHHVHGSSLPKIPQVASELEAVCKDPLKSIQALILCEADILPSVGLTIEYALRLQEKLSIEWGTSLGLEDKLRFINKSCHTFIIGNFFNPNVEKLRLEILRRLQQTHL